MICEFSLTPQIFDPTAHPDKTTWMSQVTHLVGDMFPRTGHQPICISDLYGGSWKPAAAAIAGACDEAVRGDVKKLFTRVADLCVPRDVEGEWPDSEDDWAREALTSAQNAFPISRIWASAACYDRLASNEYTSVADVSRDDCWNDVRPSRRVGMSIPDQLAALRPVLFHSTWIAFVSPYIHGSSSGDEMSLALEFLSAARAFQKNRAQPTPILLDIHTSLPPNPQNVIANIDPRLPVRDPTFQIRLFFWNFDMLDRYIIAGDVDNGGANFKQQRVRWIVTASHVARDQVNVRGNRDTPWQLLPRFEITRVFNDYYGTPPAISVARLR